MTVTETSALSGGNREAGGRAAGREATASPSTTTTLRPRGRKSYAARAHESLGSAAFAAAVTAVLGYGWLIRDEGYLTAEEGLGYLLGIIGAVMMLVLLLYPLRKRLRILRGLGRIAHWFRIHMLLGVLGPTLILLHSNFKLGSANSSIALVSMLIVAASGIVGRFIYARIHMGLYGRKALVREVLEDADAFKRAVGGDVADIGAIERELEAYETCVLLPYRSLLSSLWLALALRVRTRRSRRHLLREARRIIRDRAHRYGWGWRERRQRLNAARAHLSEYFAAVRKAAQFAFFERLFALWHVLHLPLFYFLVLAAVVHVLAVHLY